MRRLVGPAVLAVAAGCTSVQVTPVDRPLERVCIERNAKVIVVNRLLANVRPPS